MNTYPNAFKTFKLQETLLHQTAMAPCSLNKQQQTWTNSWCCHPMPPLHHARSGMDRNGGRWGRWARLLIMATMHTKLHPGACSSRGSTHIRPRPSTERLDGWKHQQLTRHFAEENQQANPWVYQMGWTRLAVDCLFCW